MGRSSCRKRTCGYLQKRLCLRRGLLVSGLRCKFTLQHYESTYLLTLKVPFLSKNLDNEYYILSMKIVIIRTEGVYLNEESISVSS